MVSIRDRLIHFSREALEGYSPFSPPTLEDLVVYFETEQRPKDAVMLCDNEVQVEFTNADHISALIGLPSVSRRWDDELADIKCEILASRHVWLYDCSSERRL